MLSVTEGQLVTLNCSVAYHCPSRPPALQWSWERGAQRNTTEPGEVRTLNPEPHRLMLLAPLSFTVSHQVKPRLRCEVSYPGARTLATLKDLHVTCEHSVLLVFLCLFVQFTLTPPLFFLYSSTKRRESSGPVPDSAGGGQCLASLLM